MPMFRLFTEGLFRSISACPTAMTVTRVGRAESLTCLVALPDKLIRSFPDVNLELIGEPHDVANTQFVPTLCSLDEISKLLPFDHGFCASTVTYCGVANL